MTTPPGGQPPYDPNQPGQPGQNPWEQQGQQPGQPYPQQPYQQQPPQPYGQPGQQPGYPGAPQQGQNNPLAITSLVLGILGIPLVCCWIGVLLSIAAIVTGFLGRKKSDESGGVIGQRGMATAGIILGIVGIVFMIVVVILAIVGNGINYSFNTNN